MSTIDFVLQLAIILFAAKTLGLLMRKLGLPQVLGFILAGILIGPAIWGNFLTDTDLLFPIRQSPQLKTFSEIGVLLIMFTAGLETDLKELKNTGLISLVIALGGVIVPLGLGFGLGVVFLGTENLISCLFVGVIMTATSVGITVETLREIGKLQTKVGTVILSAAIIDDVIGIIVLAVAISLSGGGAGGNGVIDAINPNGIPVISILWMAVYFILAVGVGILISHLFKYLGRKHPRTRRLPILSLVVCFVYAFVAEEIFGIADITGAYIAGVILSVNHKSAEYVDRRIGINSYIMFAPVFFANIGVQITFANMDWMLLLFALTFAVTAILGKIVGCGILAKACRFSAKDSLKIGVGMIARGEVALIIAQKGIDAGILLPAHLTIVVMLVLLSSVLCPILLKFLYKGEINSGGGEYEQAIKSADL